MPKNKRLSNFQIISIGFAALILLGTGLLMLPFASVAPGSAGFTDCLFTATSAVCVTGLIVRDTATAWTPFGQMVILLLIQVGGMGVVTVAMLFAFISRRRIGLKERSVMQEAIAAPQVGGIVRLTRFIVTRSLLIEAVGAVLFLPAFIPAFGLGRGVLYALFHAISAFCNAGFDLMGVRGEFSSLTTFSQNIWVNLSVCLLITVGGIGFLVWNDVKEFGLRFRRYRLQSKLVLWTSALLLLLPALWFFFFELTGLSPLERVLPSIFQSVTLRTAGFNSVDLNTMSDAGKSLMIVLMLIGGSPGSTAGGMKTTTVAVLSLTALSVFRRKDDVECYGRRLSEDTVRQAVAILVMYLTLFFLGAVVISQVDGLPLISCLFETASAIGTVGLTLGITTKVSVLSRVILILLMFLGRVGGLTLIYAAQPGRTAVNSMRPLEKVTVG